MDTSCEIPASALGPLHPRPTGWYAIAFADELAPGQLLPRTLFGRRYALFRAASGELGAIESVCPHLGADLSRGEVCGEYLRCPFHAFEFDVKGRCVATPYPGRAPPKAVSPALELRERESENLVLAWWDEQGRPPHWEPPVPDMQDWARPRGRCFSLRAHPLSTSENSVDLGHFSTVHGFSAPTPEGPLTTQGPHLHARYSFGHAFPGGYLLSNRFDVDVWGLGYSLVNNFSEGIEVSARLWILATPTQPGHIDFRIATSGKGRTPLLRSLSAKLIRELALVTLTHDVKQDFDVWEHRTHVQNPALAAGDGPIGRYRKWARQFDPRLADPRRLEAASQGAGFSSSVTSSVSVSQPSSSTLTMSEALS